MSVSYTVGGKSLTHSRQRKGVADREKDEKNRAKTSTLSSTKSPATIQEFQRQRGRGGKRNSTGEEPGNRRKAGSGTGSGAQQGAVATVGKPHETSSGSAIVTLSDLNNRQRKNKTQSDIDSSSPHGPHKSSNKTACVLYVGSSRACPRLWYILPQARTGGRKLGCISDSQNFNIKSHQFHGQMLDKPLLPSSISTLVPNSTRSSRSTHQNKTRPTSKSNQLPSDVSRTSTNSINLKTGTSNKNRSTSVRGRGLKDRGSSSVGTMAYNNGRYTSSSGLYSPNSGQVGQARSGARADDDGHQQQAPGTSSSQGSSQQPQPQTESTASSYRVIPPNSSKRQQMLTKSSQELKALEDYRASKKPAYVSGEAQSTGGSKSLEEARLAMERQHRNKKYEQILKKEQRDEEKRERERKEYEEKKARARKTAEENERRRKEREERVLKDDHSRINETFLRKLETGAKLEQSQTSVSQSPELQRLLEMFPNKKPSKLQELLSLTDNDVEKVIELLLD
ncbi:serine/arginine repetitive matrix protein 5-like [Lytechinus variegatus]|uniref:serine/arginine repetitive matrix protein 5-like n=1 Tax=Lytechinus variegatus TaxID=7654 RepID=UPI001BB298A8|nr:serine/arginine repetitive matrix protein 5-like [Lytechinus variegatus]